MDHAFSLRIAARRRRYGGKTPNAGRASLLTKLCFQPGKLAGERRENEDLLTKLCFRPGKLAGERRENEDLLTKLCFRPGKLAGERNQEPRTKNQELRTKQCQSTNSIVKVVIRCIASLRVAWIRKRYRLAPSPSSTHYDVRCRVSPSPAGGRNQVVLIRRAMRRRHRWNKR